MHVLNFSWTVTTSIAGSGGGGGGKPFTTFGGSSSSFSISCRTDPENPGQQICKRVEMKTTRDPISGQTVSFSVLITLIVNAGDGE
jgi:hypothetical protein